MKSSLMMAGIWILCAIIWVIVTVQGFIDGKTISESLLNIACVVMFGGGAIYQYIQYRNDKK